ncbi:MAG: site-2 protease family protein [Gammaproteobacteria bacterium]
MSQLSFLQQIVIWALPLLFAITFHEYAHGWIADKLGDPTAKMLGRLTLNPIKHIDPIGTIVVPIALLFLSGFSFTFGWAKPVPITWQNLKNPRRDTALVAAAGPGANFLMAIFWAIILKIALILSPQTNMTALFMAYTGSIGILINLILMVLNLLPMPPLDGGRVASSLLPTKAARVLDRIEPYGFFILLGLIVTGVLKYILLPPVFFIRQIFTAVFGL